MFLSVPRDALAFERRFRTEHDCRRALLRARFPTGFRCPRCGAPQCLWLRTRRAVECPDCGKQVSLTAGTLLHGTKLPLVTLFRLIYLVVAEKAGTNAMALSRQLSISHPTALLWMRKIRAAVMARRKSPLRGPVEMDETIVGGAGRESRGRRLGRKRFYVLIQAEDRAEDGIGRIRLRVADHADRGTLCAAVRREVEPGAEVRTDGWEPYREIRGAGFDHQVRTVAGSGRPAHRQLPLVHLVASLLKRYLLQTFQGSCSRQWIQTMLAEFEFRFNRRRSERRPLLFARLMEIGLRQRAPTRAELETQARRARAACRSL